jgi:hypothetical protein
MFYWITGSPEDQHLNPYSEIYKLFYFCFDIPAQIFWDYFPPSSLGQLCFFQEVIQASSQTAENFKVSALGVFNTSISDYQACE